MTTQEKRQATATKNARDFVRGVLVDCYGQDPDEETIKEIAQRVVQAIKLPEANRGHEARAAKKHHL